MKDEIYRPREDSYLLQKYVKKYAKGKVLDMGSGSGIQALTALKKTKDVLAVDINENAVEHVKGLGVKAKVSNLFSDVKGKFDLIIFNPPYLPGEKGRGETALSGGKKGHELIERFLKESKDHLKKGGKILLIASTLTGNIKKLSKKIGYRIKILETESFFFEKISVQLLSSQE
jgi:release factor glutamine methyltransferase